MNLMNSNHKATNPAYRQGYERINWMGKGKCDGSGKGNGNCGRGPKPCCGSNQKGNGQCGKPKK
jgi:hypothetical protein